MRVIIAGSRIITDYNKVVEAINSSPFYDKITQVVCGMARGVDMLGYQWAQRERIVVARFPADWDKYGKRGGYLRNIEMAQNADALILVWDGRSPGSGMMKRIAQDKGLKIHELVVRIG